MQLWAIIKIIKHLNIIMGMKAENFQDFSLCSGECTIAL